MLARIIAVTAALSLGWVIYMVGMILTVYDGILSLILQPFIAVLASGVCVAVALLLGLVLRVPAISRWWTGTTAALVAISGLLVLVFGYFLGLTYVGTSPETGTEVVTLHPLAALGGYFFLLFAVANWPSSMRKRDINPPYRRPLERTDSAGR